MSEEKVTQKELFARIAETMKDDPAVVELCEKNIERLSRPRKKKVSDEMIELASGVATHLAEDPNAEFTNKELVEWYNDGLEADNRISSQKMAAIMRYLVGTGTANKIVGEKASDPAKYTLA